MRITVDRTNVQDWAEVSWVLRSIRDMEEDGTLTRSVLHSHIASLRQGGMPLEDITTALVRPRVNSSTSSVKF